ncbi:MAG: tRNA (adenosine(37)-N6)-threonylcarbamoyltransferase complex dimerization subunit type 1 TsaB [Azospirillaceae bacterium]|nr:tRNA (adenosine(37)-N6)-threonylcarbamoyltransferase complex dimerization subunit type 1 TsaB [Azospirillaceae bacterium]
MSNTGNSGTGRIVALGIDTATSVCAVALWAVEPDGRSSSLAFRGEALARGQAERLLPLVAEVLAEAGVDYDAIDRYGVTIGPGAFTGLRVGLAAARGLALASSRPLLGVTGLTAFAHAAVHGLGQGTAVPAGRPLLVAIDSRREDFYLQAFDAAGRPLSEPAAVLPADLAAHAGRLAPAPLVLGDAALAAGAVLVAAGCDHAVTGIDPAGPALAVARLAALATPADFDANAANPLYIRAPDVTVAPAAAVSQGTP